MRNLLDERPNENGVAIAIPPSTPWPAHPPSGRTSHLLVALIGLLMAAVALGAIAAICMRRSYRRLSSPRQASSSLAARRGLLPVCGASSNSNASTDTSTATKVPQIILSDIAASAVSSEALVAPTVEQHVDRRELHGADPRSCGSSDSHDESLKARPCSSQAGKTVDEDWSGYTALGDGSAPFEQVEAWQAGIRLRHATKQRRSITVFEGA
jgi:hypothetical protein